LLRTWPSACSENTGGRKSGLEPAPSEVSEMVNKVYEIVTDQILKLLERGVAPWQQEWSLSGIPQNYDSKRSYRGFNLMYLWMLQQLNGWQTPYYLTFNGAQRRGWHVKKGEAGSLIVFWKLYNKTEITAEGQEKEKQRRVLRYYYVFNLDQVEGWTEHDLPTQQDNAPILSCDDLIQQFTQNLPEILTGAPRYRPSTDQIFLPPIADFKAPEHYYNTRFHETLHATGAKHRLNRPGIAGDINFGSETYSFEELTAEIGAAFLSAMSGISGKVLMNNAAYVENWHGKLKANPTWIVKAASQAQKAVDYLLPQEASKQ
jgi:antirestriction protein ArdC